MAAIRRCNDTGTAYGVCICGANTPPPVGQPAGGQGTATVIGAAGTAAAVSGAAGSLGGAGGRSNP
jgi:hypothetical protein